MGVFVKSPKMGIYYMDFAIEGVRVQKSCRTKSKKEAEQREEEARQALQIELGHVESPVAEVPEEGLTLSKAIERGYVERWAYTRDGQGTRSRLEAVVAILKDPLVTDINAAMVGHLKSALAAKGITVATTNRYLAHLKTLLAMADLDWGLPVKRFRIRLEKEPQGRKRVITASELDKVLAYLRRPRTSSKFSLDGELADLVEVIIGSGMRLGEACAITYAKHIDLMTGTIHLTGDITKSAKARDIPLTRRALEVLRDRRRENPRRPFTHPLTSYPQCWARMRRRLGLSSDKEFVIHSLRHTYGSNLSQAGVPIRHVQMLLGHGSLAMTERYTHAGFADLKSAVAVLESGGDSPIRGGGGSRGGGRGATSHAKQTNEADSMSNPLE